MTKEILKREVRFSWHLPRNDYREDLHYIREDITYKDNTVEAKTTLLTDFKRPVYVTKKSFQNHTQKKEFEDIDKLNKQLTSQSDINKTVASMLEAPHISNNPDAIKSSPFVYGYDISSTSFIKLSSLNRNNFIQSTHSVAAFDIETNPDTDEILMATIAFKGRTYTGVLKKFLKGIADPQSRLEAAKAKFLSNYKDAETKLGIFENEIDMLKSVFKVANEWKPVFLAIWNMDFDVSKILACLDRCNVNPVDVICDTTIPRKYRYFRYKQGLKKKVTASGLVKPINPSLQWHTVVSTTPFYFIDAMCVYRQLRMAEQEQSSYSLDAILRLELKSQKLKFKEAEKYKGVKEHIFLQENYPIEYIVYNLYDCLGMLELDQHTKDISNSLPSFAGITDFQKFNSQVRKVSDAVFLFGLEKRRILGTPGRVSSNKPPDTLDEVDLNEELDDTDENEVSKYKTLNLKGWIQLLPQNLLLADGLRCLEEYPEAVTNIRGISCDLDASSAYPSALLCANVSRETCVNELISIEGISEKVFRDQNLSICIGSANMLDYMTVMFNLPSIDQIDKYI